MKKLSCEVCGSIDILKENDVFVCQNCGIKYALEEVKKMITVKIDNSENIENYLNLAKHEYKLDNCFKSEYYCDKILEIDSKNYEAWLLKGKSVVWQMSKNLRIEEAVICFINALDNTPEDKIDEIRVEIANEAQKSMLSIINWECEKFLKPPTDHNSKPFLDYPSVDDVDNIIETAKLIKSNLERLLLRCGFEKAEFGYTLSKLICNVAIRKWNDEIAKEYYQFEQHPAWDEWQMFFKRGDAVVYLIEKSITLLDDEEISIATIIYENLIDIYEVIVFENDKYRSEDKIGHLISREDDNIREDKIREWHKKWNEIDSNHIIPTDR